MSCLTPTLHSLMYTNSPIFCIFQDVSPFSMQMPFLQTAIFWSQHRDLLIPLCYPHWAAYEWNPFPLWCYFLLSIFLCLMIFPLLGPLAWTHCHGPLPPSKPYHLRLSLTSTSLNSKLTEQNSHKLQMLKRLRLLCWEDQDAFTEVWQLGLPELLTSQKINLDMKEVGLNTLPFTLFKVSKSGAVQWCTFVLKPGPASWLCGLGQFLYCSELPLPHLLNEDTHKSCFTSDPKN